MAPEVSRSSGWDPRLRIYLNASVAAFRNAEAIHRDARMLLGHRRYPRAAALAVIGCEEVGKAIAFWLAGLGRVPKSNLPKLLKSLRFGGESHRSKQAISLVAWLIGDMLGKTRPALRQVLRAATSKPRGSEPASVEELQALLAAVVHDLAPAAVSVVDRHVADWVRVEAEVNAVAAGSLQRVRDQALYVDLRDGQLSEPKSIRAQEARALLERLEVMLRGFQPLAPLTGWADEAVAALSGAVPSLEEPEALDLLWSEATQPIPKRVLRRSQSRRRG